MKSLYKKYRNGSYMTPSSDNLRTNKPIVSDFVRDPNTGEAVSDRTKALVLTQTPSSPGTISKYSKRGRAETIKDIVLNPMTSAQQLINKQPVTGRGPRNIFDNALDFVNPVAIAKGTYEGVKAVGKDILNPKQALSNPLQTGLDILGVVPELAGASTAARQTAKELRVLKGLSSPSLYESKKLFTNPIAKKLSNLLVPKIPTLNELGAVSPVESIKKIQEEAYRELHKKAVQEAVDRISTPAGKARHNRYLAGYANSVDDPNSYWDTEQVKLGIPPKRLTNSTVVKEQLKNQTFEIDETSGMEGNAWHGSITNKVGMGREGDNPLRTMGHEVRGHGYQGLGVSKPNTVHAELGDLDYVNENLFKNDVSSLYTKGALEYFSDAQKHGVEKLPFYMEVKDDMLRKGIIKHADETITPEMVKQHRVEYKNRPSKKTWKYYPSHNPVQINSDRQLGLRLYDITTGSPKNFAKIAENMNKYVPAVAGAAALTGMASNDEKKKYGGNLYKTMRP